MPQAKNATGVTPEQVRATFPFPANWSPIAADAARLALMVLVVAGVFALLGYSGERLILTALGGAAVWRLVFGLAAPKPKTES